MCMFPKPCDGLSVFGVFLSNRKLAKEESKVRVFATDTILTTLMCATRSVYSWDIIVTRVGDKVFFDKRDQSALDYLTVAETAPDVRPRKP